MRKAAFLAFQLLALAVATAARADTSVSFYAHGWGAKGDFVYFPHAFVVITRTGEDGRPGSDESYGFTAVSQTPDLLFHATRGAVEPADPAYRGLSALRFSLTVSADEYRAIRDVVWRWGRDGAPLYDLKRHNCVDFIAEIARAAGLATPAVPGADPGKFLEAVRRMNAERIR